MQIRICLGCEFVIDGSAVVVRHHGKMRKLVGKDIESLLIPALGSLASGIELNELSNTLNRDEKSVLSFFQQLVDLDLIEITDGRTGFEHDDANKPMHDSANLGRMRAMPLEITVDGPLSLANALSNLAKDSNLPVKILNIPTFDLNGPQPNTGVHIVVLFDYLARSALEKNRFLVNSGKSTIFLSSASNTGSLAIGPAVVPHDSACLECKVSRRIANLTHAHETRLFLEDSSVISRNEEPILTPGQIMFAAPILLTQAMILDESKTGYRRLSELENKTYSFDLDSLQVEVDTFARYPRCNTCGYSSDTGKAHIRQWAKIPFSTHNPEQRA